MGLIDDLDGLDARAAPADLLGSMTKAQTFSREALIGTEPSKCMGSSESRRDGGVGQSPDDTDDGTYAVGSRMKLVRHPIEQNA